MIQALAKLSAVVIGTLVVTGMALTVVRWAGLRQQFVAPKHPWFELNQWKLVDLEPGRTCLAERLAQAETTDIVVIRTFQKERAWWVDCPAKQKLTEFLQAHPRPHYLIHVDTKDTVGLEPLAEELKAFDSQMSFGIWSSTQSAARFLRKTAPNWLFAADAASLLRLHLFASLGVETAFEFWPDFVIEDPKDPLTKLTAREREELDRRKKPIISH
ncbi:MAG: hypothetical protein AB7F86_08410 [Bdellovibrionales bacterium]